MKLTCNQCEQKFEVRKPNLDRQYCSRECANEGQKNGKYLLCGECGKKIYRNKSQIKRYNNEVFFCSKSCSATHNNKKIKGKIDWKAVGLYYDDGHSIKECAEKFNFSKKSWSWAKKHAGLIINKKYERNPLRSLLVKNCQYSRSNFRRRIRESGILGEVCSSCGVCSTWNNKKLTLHVDHINGINNDNRIENLRLLCPNCHSQTKTYAGKNVGSY